MLEWDLGVLGEGSAGGRQCWIASMEEAVSAADHVRAGRRVRGNLGSFNSPVTTAQATSVQVANGRSSSNSTVYRRSFRC